MFAKLDSIERRFEELERELSSPDVFNDQDRYRTLTKTHSDLGEIVKAYREYRTLEENLAESREMLHDDDKDIREMAAAEIAELEERLPGLE
ncbi:PCRF domain-containing protein, partial [Desulfobaculum sp.]